MANYFTDEMRELLILSKTKKFESPTELEFAVAHCDHYDHQTGKDTLCMVDDDIVRCSMCGETIKVLDDGSNMSYDELVEGIKQYTDFMINIIQNIKIMKNPDAGEEMMGKYCDVIAYLKKVPELYAETALDYKKKVGTASYPGIFSAFNKDTSSMSEFAKIFTTLADKKEEE